LSDEALQRGDIVSILDVLTDEVEWRTNARTVSSNFSARDFTAGATRIGRPAGFFHG
jgi:hypothetical protein